MLAPLRAPPACELPHLRHLTLRNTSLRWLISSALPSCPPTLDQLTLTFDTRYQHHEPTFTAALPEHITRARIYIDTVEPRLVLLPFAVLRSSAVTDLDYALSLSDHELEPSPDPTEPPQLAYFWAHVALELEHPACLPLLRRVRFYVRKFDGAARVNMLREGDWQLRDFRATLRAKGVRDVVVMDELGDLDRQARPL
jgi:hypothetical protein